jgi:hypothetical protein
MLIFISIFAIGLGPIPYIYPNEVFTIELRPAALSFSIFANWLCNTCNVFFLKGKSTINFICLVVTVFFPILRLMLNGYVFIIFCICCSLAFALLWYKVSVLSVSEWIF